MRFPRNKTVKYYIVNIFLNIHLFILMHRYMFVCIQFFFGLNEFSDSKDKRRENMNV